MTKLQQLQRMAEVTPVLQDYAPKVVFTRGQGYHVRRSDGMNTLWFATYEIGNAYLSAWIGSGRQPSPANIRQGIKHGTAAHEVESDPQTSVPMPTASRDTSWGIVQLHKSLLNTVIETFEVKDGDAALSWQAIGALTRMELYLRHELERAGVELVADAWADRRMAADNAWALSVAAPSDPVNLPTGESDEDYDEYPVENFPPRFSDEHWLLP
ncbi:MAG: hypothetical protein EHM48_03835 [Planctomycetaceae bacterium]|nr:MAG: hypothetical protein EHM48_03835 [Planctomycetaceae bacterium]